jgi:hypothetical protein
MPFTLTVSKETNDGKELHILGSVISRDAWDPSGVVVRLTSLRDGKPVGVVHETLTRLIESRLGAGSLPSEELPAGSETKFSLSVPSVGMTDYQLGLLWGDEAEPYRTLATTGNNSRDSADLKLRVHSIEIETLKAACAYPPCDVRYRLKAVFQNQGRAIIASAKLGVGFVQNEMLGSDSIPQDEEQVEVPNLDLEAGKSRPFKILLNKELSEDLADEITPVLRILSFSGK